MASTQTVVPGSQLIGNWELVDPLAVDGNSYIEPQILAAAVAGYTGADANADALVLDQITLPDVGVTPGQVDLIGASEVQHTETYTNSWSVPSPAMFPGYAVKVGDMFVVDCITGEVTDVGPPNTPAGWQIRDASWWTNTPWIPRVTRFYMFATSDGQSGAVTINQTPNVRMRFLTRVLRGVDPNDPFDVDDAVTAQGQAYPVGTPPNPGAVTTTTPGAYIEVLLVGNRANGITPGNGPAGYNVGWAYNPGTNRGTVQVWKRRTTPGADDPGSWERSLENWRSVTDVYKPRGNADLTLIALTMVSDPTATDVPATAPNMSQSEVQQIVSYLETGNFTITWNGQTTAAIAWNATAATIVSALEALSNIAAGEVLGFDGPLHQNPVKIAFVNGLGNQDVALMTTNTVDVVVAEIEPGHPSVDFDWVGAINCPRWDNGAGWAAGSAPQINIWALTPTSYVPGTEVDFTVSDHDGNNTWDVALLVCKGMDSTTPIDSLFGSMRGELGVSGGEFGIIAPDTPGAKILAILGLSNSTGPFTPVAPAPISPGRYNQVALATSDRGVLGAWMSPPAPSGVVETFDDVEYFYEFPTVGMAASVLPAEWEIYNADPGNGGFGVRDESQVEVVTEASSTSGGEVLRITAENVGGEHYHGGVKLKFPFTYGEMECRVRVSDDASEVTSGVVLFWPQSNQWPRDGEIDWWETFNDRDTRTPTQSYVHRLNPAATPPYDASDDETVVAYDHVGVDQSDWHKLQCRWGPNQLSIAIDNGPFVVLTDDPSHIPTWPMEVTFQLDAWSDTPPASPVTMDVDYVLIRGYTPAGFVESPGSTSWVGDQDYVSGLVALNPAASAGSLQTYEALADTALSTWADVAFAAGEMYHVLEFDLTALPANPWLLTARVDFAHSSAVRNPLRVVLVGILEDGSIVPAAEQRPGGYFAEPLGQVQTVTGPLVTSFPDGSLLSDYSRLGVALVSSERHPLLANHQVYWVNCTLVFEEGRPVVSNVVGPGAAGAPITWNYSSSSGLPQSEYEVRIIAGAGQEPDDAVSVPVGLLAEEGEIIYDSGRLTGTSVRSVTLSDVPLGRGLCTVAIRAWALTPTGISIPSEWGTATFDISGSAPTFSPVDGLTFNEDTGTVDIDLTTPAAVSRAWVLRSIDGGTTWETVSGGPQTVVASSAVTLRDEWAPMMIQGLEYLVSFDNGPMSETSIPASVGDPIDTDITSWYLVVPSSPGLSTKIEVASVDQTHSVRSITAGRRGNSVVASSRPLPMRMALGIRTRNRAERLAVTAVLESGRAIRLINILGQEWLVRVTDGPDMALQRWAPMATERTGLRDAYLISVELTEVAQ